MSPKRLTISALTALFVFAASNGGASAQESTGAAATPPPRAHSDGYVTGGGSGMGGRLPAHEGGIPGGPESEKRIPETKSRYTTCPDGSRGDLNAGGCLGGGR